jgi:hypothetical protein
MKYILDVLRMIVISVECILIKWLPAIPLGLSAYCCVDLLWKLIAPLSDSNKKLYGWPDFWRLKMRCCFSLVLSIICAGVACGLWIFSKILSHDCIGILFALSMGLSLINTGCMIYASICLRVIMEEDKSDT